MIVQVFAAEAESAHIRPVNLPHDLTELANLIEIAFGDELVMSDSHMVQDMRQTALLGGLVWMASGARLSGFVWVQDKRIVGNITLSQDPHAWSHWFVSNVAVLPDYRGRGIAGNLLDTALAHIRANHGRHVRLQVRQDYEIACELYHRRGFDTFDTLHEVCLAARTLSAGHSQLDTRLRPMRPRDSQEVWNLVCASAAPGLMEKKLLYAGDYRRTFLSQLDNGLERLLSGRSRYEWVGNSGQYLAAYGTLKADIFRGPHDCEVVVMPGERGRWESGIIGQIVKCAADRPSQNIHASVSTSHPEALDAFLAAGFTTQRVLAHMSLEIR
ncbi:MAG: GNAT family N-acetyltransferase [Anaerolineae bacterium]